MLVGAAGACLFRRLEVVWPSQPERVVQVAALFTVAVIVLSAGIYLGLSGKAAGPRRAGLVMMAAVGTVLVAFYLTWVSHYIEFPADILIWSEGDFVNDIVKFRVGYPLYTDQRNNDSFHYTPGAQLATYALARLCGAPGSIPLYRLIQLFYSLGAAAVAVGCYVRLLRLSGLGRFAEDRGLWGAVALPFFFLVATNSITNPFVGNLHHDALAQLIAAAAYWLLLEYAVARRRLSLVLMALIPALGFMVKQTLAIWIGLYALYLLFFDRPRSAIRAVGFTVAATAALALVLLGCYAVWGEPFWYWAVSELTTHEVSPLRSFEHLLCGWMYFGAGIVGGLVLLRGARAERLVGPWVIWLFFLLAVTYTSGIEWMINHLGPGCLLAGIWLLAGLTRLWCAVPGGSMSRFSSIWWLRAVLGVALVCLVHAGLGLVWMPTSPLPLDAYRYVDEIEREFAGVPVEKVLLDMGAWVPARALVVQRDQAPGIASRGSTKASGDFSAFINRIEKRYYHKILVRSLDSPAFLYDNRVWWRKSSGVKQALLENYQEAGRIREVKGEKRFMLFAFEPVPFSATRNGFQEITILTPRPVNGSG
jgi:hypothetical protein